MSARRVDPRRVFRSVGAVAVAVAVLAAADACLLVDPPGDLPRIPPRRPIIVRSSLVPPASSVLGTFPDRFIVPVEMVDPGAPFEWSAFIDFNPVTGAGLVERKTSTFQPANLVEGLRVLEVPLTAPLDLDRCHVIEIIVALDFEGPDSLGSHSPRAPGGDSVTWFYSPGGDLAGCPVLDAGPDAAFTLDAAPEGGVQ